MRVVGGRHRGRTLAAPAGRDVRPTADRTREALFNRLAHAGFGPGGLSILTDAIVLDAFCGTGALALEALSRGAGAATLMDRDSIALACARANAATLGEEALCRFLRADATAPPPNPGAAATLVLLDPPYASGTGPSALASLAAEGWVAPAAICALELSSKDEAPAAPDGFERLDARRYGAAQIVLFRHHGVRSVPGAASRL